MSASVQIEFTEEQLLGMSDDFIEQAGRLVADSFKRKRNDLICERDGHTPGEMLDGSVCSRCLSRIGEYPTR